AVIAHPVSFNFPFGNRLVGAVLEDEPLGQFLRLRLREQGNGKQSGGRNGEPSPHNQYYLASRNSVLIRCGLPAARVRKMESSTMAGAKRSTRQSAFGPGNAGDKP